MKRLRSIAIWSMAGILAIAAQVGITYWAALTEKDPELTETVQFGPDQYAAVAAKITPESLQSHIDALSRIPSRLSGTEGCEQAAEYIRGQFRALGCGEPQEQAFSVVVPVHAKAELSTASGVFKLHPLMPNGICPAAVQPDGLKTRLIYAGKGELSAVSGKDLLGATVVVETGEREQWLYLIDLGARAIIFVEYQRPARFMGISTQTLSHQDIPRFWMTQAEAVPLIAILKERDLDATLFSDARWETRTGRNIWIDLPGVSTLERNKEEFYVISSYYDSASFVPDLAPGAETTGGVAALLELGKLFKEYRFQKTVRLLATSGHFQAMEGIRQYLWEQIGRYSIPQRDSSPMNHAGFFALDLSSQSRRVGMFYTGHYYQQYAANLKPRYSDLGRRAGQYATDIAKVMGCEPAALFADTVNTAEGKEWITYLPTQLALEHEAMTLGGVPSLGFVTTGDTRYFAATPNDTEVNLDNFLAQTRFLGCLLPNAFNVEGRLLKRALTQSACRVRGQVVSFDPREGYLPSKPSPNALVTCRTMMDPMSLTGVSSRPLVMADEKGFFSIVALDCMSETPLHILKKSTAFEAYQVENGHITWAPDFGQLGREGYPTTLIPVQKEMQLISVVFPCRTLDIYNLVDPRSYNVLNSLAILEAGSNSKPSMYGSTIAESMWPGFLAPTASIYAQPGSRLKITAGVGAAQKRMLLLNTPAVPPKGKLFNTGEGFNISTTPAIYNTHLQSARDMWRLDESRIKFFASHGIENDRVNALHDLAGEAIKDAEASLAAKQYDAHAVAARKALGYESRAYPDVLGMANDVVRGLIFYLILLLPFAFAMERLFLAGRRIETRILGIVGLFLGMFFLLRLTHPAFQIVLSPMIVLLGFAVATLSTVIISIVMAKLETLVSKRKIEQLGEHESGVRAVSGFALALELGIANMRRRKARTILTSITLIVLTFSVLSFASVTAQLRTQQYEYKEGATPYQGILLRMRNWMPFPFETYASIKSEFAETCVVAPRRWYYGALVLNRSFIDIEHNGLVRSVKAMLGVTEQERKVMPLDTALLGNSRWFSPERPEGQPREEVLLPYTIANEFLTGTSAPSVAGVAPQTYSEEQKVAIANSLVGRKVSLLGRPFEVIGVFDWEKMNKFVDIDGEELTPFDPVEMEKKSQEQGTPDPESVQRYVHHSSRDIAITSERVLGNLGGDLRSIAILPRDVSKLAGLVDNLVRRLDYILFTVLDGKSMLMSSRNATRISELWNIIVLMLIAGLIVFNTMLGSVFERTKEIATYTALGIAPSHIGRLFLVEAAVFSIIGVMAGYVLGQSMARFANALDLPILSALNLNYSSLSGVGACILVMGMVMCSAIYPSRKASELGVPDIERRWKLPKTSEAFITLSLPFTVSRNEAPGLVAFLKEYLDAHVDVSAGSFYVENVEAGQSVVEGSCLTGLRAHFWLTPFDLGVSQITTFGLNILEGMDVCGVTVRIDRLSGDAGSWRRANSRFMTTMRGQFLIWRNLKPDARASYVTRGRAMGVEVDDV